MKNKIFLTATIFMVLFIFLNCHMVMADWQIQTVDNCGYVENYLYVSSLALDSDGNPHISYCDFSLFSISHPTYDLNYASSYNDGGSWNIEAVDSNMLFSSLALDSNNNPHISYSGWGGFLSHTFFYEGSWYPLITGYAPGPSTLTAISLALDSNDNPHISYQSMPSLFYAYLNLSTGGWTWDMPTLFPTVIDGSFNSLALDSNDNPHISHSDSNNDLKHTYSNGSGWVHELVANSGAWGSLAIDSMDNPQISYVDTNTYDLKYASYNGSSWDIETVDASGNVNTCSLALDSNDKPHIICQDSTGNIRYFYYNGSNWDIETVDASGNCLLYQISLALDSNDNPHITYHHSNGDLKYAYMIPDDDLDDDGILDNLDNCPNHPNGPLAGTCTEGTIGVACMSNGECGDSGVCSMNQEDTYPPQGNGIGDACDCECNFDCDDDVDADDVTAFLTDFGRFPLNNPCTNDNQCNGDCACDEDVDAADVEKFLEDFGRFQFNNPCPACVAEDWCVYP